MLACSKICGFPAKFLHKFISNPYAQFMPSALKDKTNESGTSTMKSKEGSSDKETVVGYLRSMSRTTKDLDLKYDLTKCVEILEGKENQEYIDLKGALEETLFEKERLFVEKCELAVELDYLKSREKKHRKK